MVTLFPSVVCVTRPFYGIFTSIRLKTDIIQSDAHRELALTAAQESLVLLKNADPPRGLPLGAVDTACVS